MGQYMDTIRRVMAADYENASEEEKQKAVDDVKKVCCVAASAVAVQPIPFVDIVLISPIQIALVQAIGRIHGHKLDKRSILEMLNTFGASILSQNIILSAAKFIPFVGWILSISMAYALTYAIAEVSDIYFRSGRTVDIEELKQIFKRIYKEKKTEKEKEHKANDALKDKLEQLKEALQADLITKDEFAAQKEKILADF